MILQSLNVDICFFFECSDVREALCLFTSAATLCFLQLFAGTFSFETSELIILWNNESCLELSSFEAQYCFAVLYAFYKRRAIVK